MYVHANAIAWSHARHKIVHNERTASNPLLSNVLTRNLSAGSPLSKMLPINYLISGNHGLWNGYQTSKRLEKHHQPQHSRDHRPMPTPYGTSKAYITKSRHLPLYITSRPPSDSFLLTSRFRIPRNGPHPRMQFLRRPCVVTLPLDAQYLEEEVTEEQGIC